MNLVEALIFHVGKSFQILSKHQSRIIDDEQSISFEP